MSNQANAMESRSAAWRPAAPSAIAGAPGQWLLCRAATHLWAIPIEHVIESMRALPIEVVAGAPRYMRGLCIVRGAPVPVVDTGLLVADRPTAPNRLVCVRAGDRTIALVAESVLGLRSFRDQALSQLPLLLRDAAADAIVAIGTLDAELLFLLRTARIVPDELFERLDLAGVGA
jgi:purine-binding chemotaxis protein CheW